MAFFKNGALIERSTTTTTAAGTTTLTTSSATNQQFTGTSTQTCVLPDATTLSVGRCFRVLNRSTQSITVNYNGGSLAATVLAGTQTEFRVISNGTSAGTWDIASSSSSSSGAGGSGVFQWVEDVDAPIAVVDLKTRAFVYGAALSQALYALIKVPTSYQSGNQIKLKIAPYSKDTATSNFLINAISTLIRPGTDALDSTTNQRTTTNSAVSIGAATVKIPQSVVLDLTDSTGNINGVAVTAGSLILVKLQRSTDTSTQDVYVPAYGSEVTFS